MGNRGSSLLQDEEIKIIGQETGFSPSQVERLYSRFRSLDQSGICGSLSREDFLRVPELAINPLRDRIVHMFFVDCDDDHDRINFRQFMKVLATFRSSSSTSTKINQQNNNNNNNNNNNINNNNNNIHTNNHHQPEKQGHLLFDSIDPSPFSPTIHRHSRRSSFHDGTFNSHHHHTTNQHSFRYATSSNHISSIANAYSHSLRNSHANLHKLDDNNSNLAPIIDPNEPPNSRRNKLHFIFRIYDVNNDGLIDLDDLVSVLKIMVGNYVDEPRVKRIAERSLRQADKNCDGFIDFEEFCLEFKQDIDRLGSQF